MFTANGGSVHMTHVYHTIAVFSFSVKLSSFVMASKAIIILHCSHLQFIIILYSFSKKR